MLVKELSREFEFDCHVRNLSPKTTQNYLRQISCFVSFLEGGI
ncbi:MAG: hypothetical protein ACOYI4_07220 [Christensenellales bacterium]|jgi:hypothetical protein